MPSVSLRDWARHVYKYSILDSRGRSLPKAQKVKKSSKRSMKIAINGCCHGDLDLVYGTIQEIERHQGIKVDLLLACGDFQALRNVDDLHCFACPPKYRALKDFHKYYAGQRKAYVPTIFVGGNHEAANHLWELYYGGWAAPNIYYLGAAGVVRFGGLRIGGLSGIYNAPHYRLAHSEHPPYDRSSVRSAYHIRELEVHRLSKLREPLDIFLSHDWPSRVVHYGNKARLFENKPYFRAEAERDELGSPPAWQLLEALKPHYWFSGHLHTAYPAVVPHGARGALPPGSAPESGITRFLAIDKPLPRRTYVQVVDVPTTGGAPKLEYDEEWLAILRETHGLLDVRRGPSRVPSPVLPGPAVAAEHRQHVRESLAARGGAVVPPNFVQTVEVGRKGQGSMPQSFPRNPQTEALLELIGRPYNLERQGDVQPVGGWGDGSGLFDAMEIHNYDPHGIAVARDQAANPEEIDLGEFSDSSGGGR